MGFDLYKIREEEEKTTTRAEEWEKGRRAYPVYFGLKQGVLFLFQKDGIWLRGVFKILSIVKTQVIQDSIIKSAKEQKVIQYEDAMPMLIFRETTMFIFAEGDYAPLENDHPFVEFYHKTIDNLNMKRKEAESQKKN